jgi:hypothetical protein
MEQKRKEQLSIYFWLKDLFPTFVNIVDEYPTDDLTLPTVAIISQESRPTPHELGGRDLVKRSWSIYVFAKNSGQRDDYLSLIEDSLETSCIFVYDYTAGFPPAASPPQIGSLYVESRDSKPLRVFEDLIKKKYWWGVVNFRTYVNPS